MVSGQVRAVQHRWGGLQEQHTGLQIQSAVCWRLGQLTLQSIPTLGYKSAPGYDESRDRHPWHGRPCDRFFPQNACSIGR